MLWYNTAMKKTINLPKSIEEKDALILAQQEEIERLNGVLRLINVVYEAIDSPH